MTVNLKVTRAERLLSRDAAREADYRRACTDLWWLSTEILGYTLLTEDFHKPMMDEMDRRTANPRYRKSELWMWPRDYYKTTVKKARIIQAYLRNPDLTVTWWHAVEEMAQEACSDIAGQFKKNKKLRALMPASMRPPANKKLGGSSSFSLPSRGSGTPSMRAWGAGSEATGGHSVLGVLDDIVGMNDIEDQQMPKKRRWFSRTVMNVVRTDVGRLWAIGTHWDLDDIYADWRKDRDWDVVIRACYETDGVPDWNGKPVLYSKRDIEKKRRAMSDYEFSCQMMLDPLPDEARMWQPDSCEHFCDIREASRGRGRVFVLSDPAPAHSGAQSSEKEVQRGDGSKDWWSIAVVRIRVIGAVQEIILLDGSHSQGWPRKSGIREAARLAAKWQTNMFFNEAYGGLAADYSHDALEIFRECGVSLYLEPDGSLPRYADTYRSGAKNHRFEGLCDLARQQRFRICETVPQSFLYGDAEHVGFLTQSRKWRALARGRNTCKWDDDADVVARSTDARLQEFAPQVMYAPRDSGLGVFSPFATDEDMDAYVQRSRYCGV